MAFATRRGRINSQCCMAYAKLIGMSHTASNQAPSANEVVSAAIRYRLWAQGKSQSSLAEELGWSVFKLGRRLKGDPAFTITEMEQIANALNIRIVDLLAVPTVKAQAV